VALKIASLRNVVAGALAGFVALTSGYMVFPNKANAQQDRVFAGISIPLTSNYKKAAQNTRFEVGYAHLNNNGNIGFSGEVFVTPAGVVGVAGDTYTGTEDAGISGGVEVGYDIPNHKFEEALRAAVQVQKGTANLGVKLPFSGVMKPNLSGLECTLGLGTPKWDKDKKSNSDPDTTTSSGGSTAPSSWLF